MPGWARRACIVFGALVWLALATAPSARAADAAGGKAQTVVHLLDYVGVDYPEFVKNGEVLNASEYAEQREFATQSIALLEQLPAALEKAALLERARQLLARIDAKAAGAEVSGLAGTLRSDVIRVYKLTVAPRQAPDLPRAMQLFAANCAACHGAQGHGDGALAKGMDPSPSDFHDEARMKMRSIYGLYNTIALGVAGTPMRPFTELSEADRWALAFFVSGLRATPDAAARGQALWEQGKGKAEFTGFGPLVSPSPGEVVAKGGAELGEVQTYLTLHPEAIAAAAPTPLAVTRAKLDEALQAYRAGDRDGARQHAITAYLEGFELIEASLDNVDAPLRTETERAMMALRSAIAEGQPVQAVADQIGQVNELLARVDMALSAGSLSPTTAFVSSLLILLREGLEAILVLAAIIAFIVKTGRRDVLPYVHAGWIAALVLGVATWAVAHYLLAISGANREITEGITALVAAAMLLYVGYWLHSKSYAQAWATFIRNQVSAALSKRTVWTMAGVSFLAVYRELFEIILFYETLWVQVGADGRMAVLGGIVAAAVLLALIGTAILKYSVRLPIGPFFAVTSGLLALMAVVFVGNGVAALQEAGVIDATLVHFISVPLLGVHPTAQGLLMQLGSLALVVAGVLFSRHQMAQTRRAH
jgi:high-affinity iron transporter